MFRARAPGIGALSPGPRHVPAIVALVVGFVFSIVAFRAMLGWEKATAVQRAEGRFEEQANNVNLRVQQGVSQHLAAAAGVEAFFEASEEVTRAEFDTFTRGLLRENPSIRRIAWAPRVPAADRAAFEAQAGREVPGFRVRAGEEGVGDVLYPVLFASRMTDPAQLGLDLAGVPAFREALAHAAATGRGATVGPLPLAPLGGGDGVGAAVLLPFYRASARDAAPLLQGVVVELLDVGALVGPAVEGLDVWLSDGAGRPVMAWDGGVPTGWTPPPATGLVRRSGLMIGDQVWTLALAPPADVAVPEPGNAAWLVLAVGLVASVAGAGYLARLQRVATDLSSANRSLGREMARRQDAERTRERLSGVLEATTDLVAMADPADHLLYLNRAGRALVGIGPDEDIGRTLLTDLLSPTSRAQVSEVRATLGDTWEAEVLLRRRGGPDIPAIAEVQTHHTPDGAVEYRSAIAHDIRERKEAERQLERHAYYDELTGLPNRRLLERRLAETIAEAGAGRVAVLLLSPERFRFVSLSLGPAYRDLAMVALARRFEGLVRPGETLARYEADTFALVLPAAGVVRVQRVCDALFEAMAEPLVVEGAEIRLGLSIGACFHPDDGVDVAGLLRHADAALHRASELGGGRCELFTAELHQRLQDRVTMEAELRRAIERDELTLYYQPQLDLASGRVTGVEALLRWRHPRHGLLGPSQFVKVAEDTRLILPIGEWVLENACRQARAWREAGVPPLQMGVNVSANQFGQADIEARIRGAMRAGAMHPGELEIELTESTLMADPDELRELLGRLRDSGCRIAIDDFGTGYSSLSYLKQLPIDRLKIDQSFVRDIGVDASSAGIVRTIIAMAGHIGLDTIAEGVSTAAQAEFLRREGCPAIQGYFVSKPVPAEEVPRLRGLVRPPGAVTPA